MCDCAGDRFKCLDHWGLLWGSGDLYKRYDLHLNWWGPNILAGRFAAVTREGLNENGRGWVPEQ